MNSTRGPHKQYFIIIFYYEQYPWAHMNSTPAHMNSTPRPHVGPRRTGARQFLAP
jgi:hypothetical protein